MSPELRAALRLVVEAYPAGSTVPVLREHALELLEGNGAAAQTFATPPADLTVADLCTRCQRKPSAVRAWLERGDIPEAYKLQGRDWRVPAAALEAYLARQQNQAATAPEPGDLGAWRRARQSRA